MVQTGWLERNIGLGRSLEQVIGHERGLGGAPAIQRKQLPDIRAQRSRALQGARYRSL